MAIRVCVAGATGWTGRAVTGAILVSSEFQLVGAIARRHVGEDIGEALGQENGLLKKLILHQIGLLKL
jgi:4-hydroxy-tetrahydrodipicolinate reductase